jgi:hypothetical protein
MHKLKALSLQIAIKDNALFDVERDATALDPRWNPMGTQGLRGDMSHKPLVTLPDAGSLLMPAADVIRNCAPQHMQKAAEDLGITSIHLKHTLRSGTVSAQLDYTALSCA